MAGFFWRVTSANRRTTIEVAHRIPNPAAAQAFNVVATTRELVVHAIFCACGDLRLYNCVTRGELAVCFPHGKVVWDVVRRRFGFELRTFGL